jgi:hypothetical protein
MGDYKLETYRLDPVNSLLEKLDEIEGYSSLEFDKKLNNYGSSKISIDPRHKKATLENFRRWVNHIAIKKGDTIVWFGPITKLSPTIGRGVQASLEIEAREHLVHLNHRFTDSLVKFIQTDAGEIAWSLIDTSQNLANGDLMFREGNIAVTGLRDETYEYAKILDKVMSLSNTRGGFDFDTTYQQDSDGLLEQINFNVYTRKGAARPNLPVWKLGENGNIGVVKAVTVGEMVNTVTYLGAGTGSDVLISPLDDVNVQQAYGRRENVVKDPDISLKNSLDRKAQSYLDYNKVERYDVQIELNSIPELSYGTFSVGDTVEVDARLLNEIGGPTLINFQGSARVLAINVEIDKNGGEILTPTISAIF